MTILPKPRRASWFDRGERQDVNVIAFDGPAGAQIEDPLGAWRRWVNVSELDFYDED